MATAEQVLAIARGEVGVTESPANSNRVKYWGAYSPYWQGEPWCDRFVSWCGWKAGAADIVGVFDYCPYHVNWFKQRGQWKSRTTKPKPGWIVFFGNNSSGEACHVGLVTGTSGAYVYTIEGNTSSDNNANGGRVEARTRTVGTYGSSWYILGYGAPDYEEDEVTNDDINKIVNAVWGKGMKGDYTAQTYLENANDFAFKAQQQLTRTDDPTGRGKNMTLYDHIKWIGAKQATQGERLDAIETKLDKLIEKLGK